MYLKIINMYNRISYEKLIFLWLTLKITRSEKILRKLKKNMTYFFIFIKYIKSTNTNTFFLAEDKFFLLKSTANCTPTIADLFYTRPGDMFIVYIRKR